MSRAFAVPVWISISETPELSNWGTVTEEERVDGILRLDGESLVLEVEISQSTTTLDGRGQRTEREDLGLHEFRVPFDELVGLSVHRRWFLPYLKIPASRLDTLRGLPGAKQGVAKLRVSHGNWGLARTLVAELEIARADLALERAQRLEEGEQEALPAASDPRESAETDRSES